MCLYLLGNVFLFWVLNVYVLVVLKWEISWPIIEFDPVENAWKVVLNLKRLPIKEKSV